MYGLYVDRRGAEMNVRKLSVNKACIFLAVLLLAAMVTISVALYALTQDITAVWYVLLFGIFVLFCSICFMVLVRRKSVSYTHLDVYKRQGYGRRIWRWR